MSERVIEIQALHAAEEGRRHRQVSGLDELPLSYEAVTDAWLTAALCGEHPGVRVIGHQWGPPDDGTSNRRRLNIAYDEAGSRLGLPTALFCKASHGIANRMALGLTNAAYSEVQFYTALRRLLPIEAPVGLFARYDQASCNSIVILEDLGPRIAGFCDQRTPVSRDRAEGQVALLAAVHGAGYADARIVGRLSSLVAWPDYFADTTRFGLREGAEQGFRDAAGIIPARLSARADEIWPATLASVERQRHLPHTLCHGDVHLKNWYVTRDGRMGLSDWQCTHRGHWGRDLAYAISTALSIDDRRAWEEELLRFYLDRLRAAGGPSVNFAEAWLHYRQQLPAALAWWTVTLSPPAGLPDMQPHETAVEFVRRIATAIDDLGSLDTGL